MPRVGRLVAALIVAALMAQVGDDVPARTVSAPVYAESGSTQTPPAGLESTPSVRLADAESGLVVFDEHCAGCHGTYGQGDGPMVGRLPAPPPDFSDPAVARRLDPLDAYQVVTEGRLDRLMPPFRNSLSEQQRRDAVAAVMGMYLTPERLARSEPDFDGLCAACHIAGAAPRLGSVGLWTDDAGELPMLRDAVHRTALDGAPQGNVAAGVDFARSLGFAPLAHGGLRLDGTLRGVVRLQPAGTGVANAAVRAVPFALGFPGEVITMTTSPLGEFSAAGMVNGPDVAIALATSYRAVEYTAVITGGLTSAPVELEVYQTTETATLHAASAHLLVSTEQTPGVLEAVELWSITNPATRTLTAAMGGETLAFSLPEGAMNARFGDAQIQARATVTDGRIATTAAIIPGDHQISLEYSVPYKGNEIEWRLQVAMRVDDFRVAAIGSGLRVEAGEAPVTAGEAGGRPVSAAALGALEAGDGATVRFSGLTAPLPSSGGAAGRLPARWAAFVATGAAAVGAIATLLFPRRGRTAAALRRRRRLRAERSAALDSVAELDVMAGNGMIDAAEHRTRRAELLEAALRSTRALEQESPQP